MHDTCVYMEGHLKETPYCQMACKGEHERYFGAQMMISLVFQDLCQGPFLIIWGCLEYIPTKKTENEKKFCLFQQGKKIIPNSSSNKSNHSVPHEVSFFIFLVYFMSFTSCSILEKRDASQKRGLVITFFDYRVNYIVYFTLNY